MLEQQLRPWHEAVERPAAAQLTVLRRLLTDYARTGYGSGQGAAEVMEADGGAAGHDDADTP